MIEQGTRSAAHARRREVPLPALTVLGGLVLSFAAWARLDESTRATVWAEDGDVFLRQRIELGWSGSLFEPYDGYLHVVPRLVTDLAFVAPLSQYAVAVSVLCCLVVGAVGATVFLCSHAVLNSWWSRAVLAALTVLAPAAPVEVLGNSANLHTYFLWLTPWLLLAQPTRWWQGSVLGALALLASLTEIQSLLFLPLIFFGFGNRYRWPVIGGLLVGLIAQSMTPVLHPRLDRTLVPPGPLDLVKGYLVNVLLPLWRTSTQGVGQHLVDHGWWLALWVAAPLSLSGVLALCLLVRLRKTSPDEARRGLVLLTVLVAGAAIPFSAAFLVNPTYAGPMVLVDYAAARPLRYGVAAALFALAIPILAADLVGRTQFRWSRSVTALLLIGAVATTGAQFSVDGRRSEGPAWKAGVADAQRRCVNDSSVVIEVDAAPSEVWAVPLTCAVLNR